MPAAADGAPSKGLSGTIVESGWPKGRNSLMIGIMRSFIRLAGAGYVVLRTEGLLSFFVRFRRRLRASFVGQAIILPVATSDATNVDWSSIPEHLSEPTIVADGPIEIAWIMSPPSPTSGGHQNLLRFIDFAEQAGHRCAIYFYSTSGITVNIRDMKQMIGDSAAYPNVTASMQMYDADYGVHNRTQAIFATGWETAYPVFLDPSRARRFYFVQDFEPSFYPVGSEATFAENTYRFGFHGLTAGRWLATKLQDEFGMATDSFDFAVDKAHYSLLNTERRKEIFFYARPVTPRRGFELGIMALTDFAKRRPDVKINLAGWDVSNWDIPFKFVNHSGLAITDLNALYNRCAAGLVLSMSNMSLLPLELMSSGVVPVVNDAPNNRMVYESEFIEYVPPAPLAISHALERVVDAEDAVERAVRMSQSVENSDWRDSGRVFVAALERAMRG